MTSLPKHSPQYFQQQAQMLDASRNVQHAGYHRSQLKTNAALSKEFGSSVPQTVTPTSTAAGLFQLAPRP
jgi:hypothetical protein